MKLKVRKVFEGFYSGSFTTEQNTTFNYTVEKKGSSFYLDVREDSDWKFKSSSIKGCLEQLERKLKFWKHL